MQKQSTGTNTLTLSKSLLFPVILCVTRHTEEKTLVQDASSVLSEYKHSWKRCFMFWHRLVLSNIFNISSLDGGDLHKFLIDESFILNSACQALAFSL